jgi:hypothetical protein
VLGAFVLGAFVADAATMPLHWIYDVAQIKQLVGDGAPTFFHPPSCPFYDVRQPTTSRVNLAARARCDVACRGAALELEQWLVHWTHENRSTASQPGARGC